MKCRPPMTYTVLSDNTLNIQECVTYIGVLKCRLDTHPEICPHCRAHFHQKRVHMVHWHEHI